MKHLAHLLTFCAFVGTAATVSARQSVTLTSTADFQRGNNEGLVSPAQERVTRDRVGAGTVGAWSPATALPVGTDNASAVAHNGFAYLIGGRDVDYSWLSSVRIAPIAANGSLGSWTSATSLPSARGSHTSVAYNNFVYAIGGLDVDYNVLDEVLVAPLNANGTLGGWTSTTPLPSGRYYSCSVAYNGHLYVIGGLDNALTDVLVAPFHADGTLGVWSSTTPLPSDRAFHSCVAYNGFLYVIGGGASPYDVVTEVLVAPLEADGSVGPWTSTTALPAARGTHSSVVAGGFLYALGGMNGDTVYDEVLSAPINGDGSLGAWSAASSLPTGRGFHSTAAYNGFLYTFGGMDDTFTILPDAVLAPIDADAGVGNQALDRLRGVYSHLVDMQSDLSTRFIILAGQLSPGGAVRMQVRIAPEATGIFGAETVVDPAPLDDPIEVPGTGRYVWIRLTLDDTSTTDVSQGTYVSDITISPIQPPTAGVVFDGFGADIDSQTSTSTIEANWSGFTANTGDAIVRYEWAIGTASGLINVQGWTNAGLATSASNASLTLSPGVKFVSVRAVSSTGLTSSVATSDGVQVVPASFDPGGGGGSDHKSRCGQSASPARGSALAMLAGLVLLATACRSTRKLGMVACLIVGGAAAAEAQQPVTLTSTADFQRGNNEGLVSPAQERVTRDRVGAGTVGSWTSSTGLPSARLAHSSAACNGFLYSIGGLYDDYSVSSEVLMAAINADGSVGSWAATTELPAARGYHTSVVYNGYIYVIGGLFAGNTISDEVLVAPINADGSIGDWSATTALPSGRQNHASVVFNGFIYSIGGFDENWNQIYSAVLVAPLQADGSVGAWTPTTSLPAGRAYHSSAVYNGFLYVLGGFNPDFAPDTEVRVAAINDDGSVGDWSETTALTYGRLAHSSLALNGFLYVISGSGYDFYNEVHAASINPDGSIEDWVNTEALPYSRENHTTVAYNGRLYFMGGYENGVFNQVLVAPLEADDADANQAPERLRGVYSHLVDFQTDAAVRWIVLNGQVSTGGVIRLQLRVAPDDTKVFGAETVVDSAPLGSAIAIAGPARYVWIRITLDDTAAGNPDQASYVSDIAFPVAPSTGVVFDGLASDIDSQSSASTIEANWSGFAAAAGDVIARYEWAIGTSPGLTNVQAWTNAGLATSATNSSLSLSSGMKYVSVRAVSALGPTSSPATSDGVQVLAASTTPGGGGGSSHKGRCGQSASAAPGSALAMLAGLVLLATARRSMRKPGLMACLFVGGAAAADAQQPVTLTSTADFQRGNNEGLVSPAQDRVTRDRISGGTLGAWASTPALPSARLWHASAAHNGFLYVAGGADAGFTVLDEVWVAPLLANGSVGQWSATTPLPSGRVFHSMLAYNGFLFAIGGGDSNFETLSEVLVAPLAADGSVGDWTATTPLPSGSFSPSAAAWNGFMYIVGGLDNVGGFDDVLVAALKADGSLGSWAPTTPLPSGRGHLSTVAHDGHLYAIGGYDGALLSDCLVAPLSANGSVGSWVSTTPLPFARDEHSSVAHNGFVYILGGYDADNAAVSDVIAAPLNADGSLGSWSPTTDLPFARSGQRSVAYNGFIYTIGGGNADFTPLADVIVASIEADDFDDNQAPARLRGAYSLLADLQSDSSTRWIFIDGQLSPGGVVRVQIRVAPEATQEFGDEMIVAPASLGSSFEVPGNGRYVWIRIVADDTATGDSNQPTHVSEITISPSAPPTPGAVFDGDGADIDTQTSTSTMRANWSGFIPTGGDALVRYEWAIGAAPGLSNVQGWVNVGLATSASNSSLSLSPGVKYVSVRAISALGLVSSPATSDGVQVLAPSTIPAGGGGDHKSRCGQSASAAPGSALAMLAGVVLMAMAGVRRPFWTT